MGRMHSKRFDIMPDKLFTIVAGVNGVGESTYIAKPREKRFSFLKGVSRTPILWNKPQLFRGIDRVWR